MFKKNYKTEKITHKAHAAVSGCLVLPPEIIMHDALMLFSEHRLLIYLLFTYYEGRREEEDYTSTV